MRSPAVRAGIAVTVSTPLPRALSPVSVLAFYTRALCSAWPVRTIGCEINVSIPSQRSLSTEGDFFNQDGNIQSVDSLNL